MLVPPRSGAENMARDVVLLERAKRSGEAVFSVYEWHRPTLSFGRNQIALSQYDRNAIRAAGFDVVRRPTGGRALLHNREVTYSVAAPTDGTSLRDTYQSINRILQRGLSLLGVDTRVAIDGISRPPNEVPCFADPAPGELVVQGRKLVGSAQLREDGAFLQHGSILIEDDQPLLRPLMTRRDHYDSLPAAATLLSILGRKPATGEVATALFAAVRELEDNAAKVLGEAEIRSEAVARSADFENEVWTWRR